MLSCYLLLTRCVGWCACICPSFAHAGVPVMEHVYVGCSCVSGMPASGGQGRVWVESTGKSRHYYYSANTHHQLDNPAYTRAASYTDTRLLIHVSRLRTQIFFCNNCYKKAAHPHECYTNKQVSARLQDLPPPKDHERHVTPSARLVLQYSSVRALDLGKALAFAL